MKLYRGIPDDTPENTVRAIKEILTEEAAAIGASIKIETKPEELTITETIDLKIEPHKSVRVILSYVESQNLAKISGTIGSGFIGKGYAEHGTIGETWRLELIPQDMLNAPHSPPFRWGLYPESTSDVHKKDPTHVLDGSLLRQLIRERLGISDPP